MAREVITAGDIRKFNQSEAGSRIPAGTTYPVTKMDILTDFSSTFG